MKVAIVFLLYLLSTIFLATDLTEEEAMLAFIIIIVLFVLACVLNGDK